jgi:hypothetical protein
MSVGESLQASCNATAQNAPFCGTLIASITLSSPAISYVQNSIHFHTLAIYTYVRSIDSSIRKNDTPEHWRCTLGQCARLTRAFHVRYSVHIIQYNTVCILQGEHARTLAHLLRWKSSQCDPRIASSAGHHPSL